MFSFSEKVLRNLMNRIKSQREEWMTSHSMVEVGDTQGVPQPTETGEGIVEFVLGTVELQWLELLWDHRKFFETWVVRANEG